MNTWDPTEPPEFLFEPVVSAVHLTRLTETIGEPDALNNGNSIWQMELPVPWKEEEKFSASMLFVPHYSSAQSSGKTGNLFIRIDAQGYLDDVPEKIDPMKVMREMAEFFRAILSHLQDSGQLDMWRDVLNQQEI